MDPAPDPAPLEQDPEEFIRQERCVSAKNPFCLFPDRGAPISASSGPARAARA